MEHNHEYGPEAHIALDFHADCPKCRLYSKAESLLLAAEKAIDTLYQFDSEITASRNGLRLQAIIDAIRGKEPEEKK